MAPNYKLMREKAGVSGADFARLVGSKVDRIYRVEAGSVKPTDYEHSAYASLVPLRREQLDTAVLGDILRDLRFKAHLTRADCAKRLGVSEVSIWRWESARAIPNENQIMSYSKIGGNVKTLKLYRKLERKKDRREIKSLVMDGLSTVDRIVEYTGLPAHAVRSTLNALVNIGWLARKRHGPKWIYSGVSDE